MPAVVAVVGPVLLAAVSLLVFPRGAWADCINMVSGAGGHAFWKQVQLGAEQAAREGEVRLYFRGPQQEVDAQLQLRIIDKMLERPCRALIVAPSAGAIAARLAELKRQGIATLYVDRDLGGDEVLAAVATDNYQAGLLAGRQMARLLEGQGRVALLRPHSSVQSIEQRARGFLQGAGEGGLQVVLDRQLPAREHSSRTRLARELRELDGVFTANESTSLATLGALRRIQAAGTLVHIGFDSSPLLVEALQRGEIAGLVVQQPYQMGYQSVQLALRHLRGEAPGPRKVELTVVYIDRHNLADKCIQRLLQP